LGLEFRSGNNPNPQAEPSILHLDAAQAGG
jgi:hypothetical protein